jgi:hypothetical protein
MVLCTGKGGKMASCDFACASLDWIKVSPTLGAQKLVFWPLARLGWIGESQQLGTGLETAVPSPFSDSEHASSFSVPKYQMVHSGSANVKQ